VYSLLLDIGEREAWVTNHCAAVGVVTPYDNRLIIMHEGASGGGKSEMTEHIHRMEDGRLLLGRNLVTGEERTLALPEACHLYPVADDMACAHPSFNKSETRLNIVDAENAPRKDGDQPQRAPDLPQPPRRARRPGPHLGTHRGRPGQALPQPARHHPAPHDP
jgi:hypothetical protein